MLRSAADSFIYLASRSPRRQELLRQIGVRFELLVADAGDEDEADEEALEAVLAGESPTRYVQRVTLAKAEAAHRRWTRRALPDAPILVSDTTVALGGRIFGKPIDADDARRMLQQLAGRSHRVLTAVAVRSGTRTRMSTNVSRVNFARMTAHDIETYLATGEPFGKAGAYAIQGAAARFVRRIEGSHSGIMGLPLYETSRLLRGAGRTTR